MKQALVGLEGVVSVEDEWERNPESKDNLDLLYVRYHGDRVSVGELVDKINERGFQAEVKSDTANR